MLFNSYIFILLFLPLCFSGYFLLNKFNKTNLAQLFLLVMSLWFYAFFNVKYLFLILGSIAVNYSIYLLFKKNKSKHRRILLLLGLSFNIGILLYFKYMDFFISNINTIFNTNFPLLHILLPLGISFFTFQQLSFIIDSYKNEIPDYNLLFYASFVVFFPQLIAGPIVTYDELIPQFLDKRKKTINWDNLAKGIYAFAIGLAKKVIIADTLGLAVNYGYANINILNSTNAIIIMLAYTFQIYFDFSGYSDMAIGIGKMFNIDLPINFNSPYKSYNINEFWDKWHMTLTRFFTKYVYIPLGGNRKGKIRSYINIMIVFLISGFWHGANWTFILWGLLHGLFSLITKIFKAFFEKLHSALNWLITFTFINITWIFFRANSISDALNVIYSIFRFDFGQIDETILGYFKLPEFYLFIDKSNIEKTFPNIVIIIFFVIILFIVLQSKNTIEKMNDFKPSVPRLLFTIFLLMWCILSFSGISTFLYFNF